MHDKNLNILYVLNKPPKNCKEDKSETLQETMNRSFAEMFLALRKHCHCYGHFKQVYIGIQWGNRNKNGIYCYLLKDTLIKKLFRNVPGVVFYLTATFSILLVALSTALRTRLRIRSVISVNYHYINVLCPFTLLVRFKCYNTV